ncbi:unnamed protein product [Agarophyton chilense]
MEDAKAYNGRTHQTLNARPMLKRPPTKRPHVVCIAVIAPNNALMYMSVFNPTKEKTDDTGWIQMQEVIYNSLDVVEERIWSVNTRAPSTARETDGFLGCLAVVGRTCVFGSVTKSLHKSVVVIRDGHDVADATVRAVLTQVNEAVVLAMMNCLVPPNHVALRSPRFDQRMHSIAHEFNSNVPRSSNENR